MVIRLLAFFLLILLAHARELTSQSPGHGPPKYSADGRIALSWNSNIWVVEIPDDLSVAKDTSEVMLRWLQITKGPAHDRDPVWRPDGRSLVFASDRAGAFDLWQVDVPSLGAGSQPVRIIQSVEPDMQPTVDADGTIVWVRGVGPDANLWIKDADGKQKQLTDTVGAEMEPAFSPDGSSIAYIAERKGRRKLRILKVATGEDTLAVSDLRPEVPAWSPVGDRIAFTSRGEPAGVWITTPEGLYKNLLSSRLAAADWSPDGRRLVLASMPRAAPAYNGDPEGFGDRVYEAPLAEKPGLIFVNAPPPPDAEQTTVFGNVPQNSDRYVERFDRVVKNLTQNHVLDQGPDKDHWRALKQKYRTAAQNATSPEAAEEAIYSLLRDRPLLRQEASGRAGISSAHPLATRAGIEILEKGGNVVDAAVAVSFALGVVEPDASGIGGYGEMLIFLKDMAEPVCIEFLTRVPEAAALTNGALIPLPREGPVLANVPGTVAGMELAWKRYGSNKLNWAELIEPAIKQANEGFILDDAFTTTLAKEKERYLQYESTKTLFFREGRPLQPGDTLRNPDLAWTLTQIAEGGAKAFYEGEVAKRMIEDLRSKDNVMTLHDLARYYAVERKPVMTTYRGHTIYSGAPPVSGGATLAGKLNLLEQWPQPKPYRDDAATLHAMIEAWKLAPSTRGRVADPGLWPVDLKPFTDKRLAKERWQSCFNASHSTMPDHSPCLDRRVAADWGAEDVLEARSSNGTTAFVVADAKGNMVSVTQTLGTWGGNFYVTPGLGFIYNDKLRSYDSDPKRYNARIPFARNVTSIAPTMVFKGTDRDKHPYLAVGAAGNAWITSAVYQIVAGVLDQGLGPQQAIEQPRFLVAMRRDSRNREKIREIVVQLEDGFAPGILRQLRAMGHQLQRISLRGELRMGYASAAVIERNQVRAGADPRRSGWAAAIK
ncbi:gamma-glutamyltransferase [bacterium]|nr:gamma-glutamyltransferase [bacterium]